MRFSVKYLPTTLFSLKDSNATNSGAKSLFLPSPYAIKMAVLNQAITVGGDLEQLEEKKSKVFGFIRDAKISYYIQDNSFFSVNNSFVKILKPARDGGGFGQTVAFREYLFLSHALEIIFDIDSDEQKEYLKKYLHKINYFGKKGCFFQFVTYNDNPNEPNVTDFDAKRLLPGVLQEYDDFDSKCSFDRVNNFSSATTKRGKRVMLIPVQKANSSKSYSIYRK
ncbi:hypothetical protein DC498_10625 [Terrimonas sp.]|uniref:hypothetical protein n=1 Tax=Terrimonas sp. TaxID=1914338 RepID=UPI000D518A83|nr:hypothetical protein [Terrimonas sp.]PVD52175.1 hypothetical protein DC498_10625 [Terrimonas sp.]